MNLGTITVALTTEHALLVSELTAALNRVATAMEKFGAAGVPARLHSETGASAPIPVTAGDVSSLAGSPRPTSSAAGAAMPERPAAEVSFAGKRSPSAQYSEAQIATIRRMYLAGATDAQITDSINQMPGARPLRIALSVKLVEMRKKGLLAKRADMAPRELKISSPAPGANPKGARNATRGWLLQWANQRNMCADGVLDLAVVNAKARQLGLPDFVVEGGA